MLKANNQAGLTLIELMIAVVMSGMLLAVMVMAFTAQSRTYNTQQEVSVLQEDMKAALQLLSRDIRMAGYNPTGAAGWGITVLADVTSTRFRSTQDLDGNGATGGTDEDVLYSFATPFPPNTASLMRRVGAAGTPQPVIDNLTRVGFEYLVVTPVANAQSIRTWTSAPAAADLENIRAVNICIQGRTPRQTSTTVDTGTFMAAFNTPPGAVDWSPAAANRGAYQWRTMCVEVKCRNLL